MNNEENPTTKPSLAEITALIDNYVNTQGDNFFSEALAEEVIETLPGRTENEVKVEGLWEAIAAFTPTEGPSDLEGPPLTEEGEALHSMYMAGWRESQETMLYVFGKYADKLGFSTVQ